jgi:hypothetical protein
MMEVTGEKVNRGGGYGLEIPCKYHFFLAQIITFKDLKQLLIGRDRFPVHCNAIATKKFLKWVEFGRSRKVKLTGGLHLGPETVVVIRSREVVANQGVPMY